MRVGLRVCKIRDALRDVLALTTLQGSANTRLMSGIACEAGRVVSSTAVMAMRGCGAKWEPRWNFVFARPQAEPGPPDLSEEAASVGFVLTPMTLSQLYCSADTAICRQVTKYS